MMNVFQKQRQFLSLESAAPRQPGIWRGNAAPSPFSAQTLPDLARSPEHAAGVGERLEAMGSESIEQRDRPATG